MKANAYWDGNPDFEFTIEGYADCGCATDPDSRKSVSGYSVFLCGVPVSVKSGQQKIVAISVTEGERSAGTVCAQDMLYVMRIVESVMLKVKKPMKLTLDNKGAVDLTEN